MRKPKSKPKKRPRKDLARELRAKALLLDSFPDAHTDEVRQVTVAAKALMMQAVDLGRRPHAIPHELVGHWLNNANRLLGMLLAPMELEHVLAVENKCEGCGGLHNYVLSFKGSNEEMQASLEMALTTVKPELPAVNVVTPKDGMTH